MSEGNPVLSEEECDALEWAVEWAEDVFAESGPDTATRERLEAARRALRKARGGFTVIEVLVSLAILMCLAGLLATGIHAAGRGKGDGIPTTSRLWTVRHDEHLWVVGPKNFLHHPSCPCRLTPEQAPQ